MKKILLSSVLCATMMLAANNEYKYEITPMLSADFSEHNMDLANSFANGGLALGFNQTNSFIDQVELGFLRSLEDVDFRGQNRDTGITRVFTNLVKEYDLSSNFSLYSLVGAGVEFFDDEHAGNQNGVFGNYGIGMKMKMFGDTSLKMDLRHLIEADHGDNTLLYNVGLAMPFGEVAKPAPVVVEKPKPAPVVKPAPIVVEKPLDTDGDGVIDSLDQCPDTMRGAEVDSVGCMTLVNLNINFDTNSSTIKPSYDSRIEDFAKMMKMDTRLKATIEAHTDSDGSNAYNQKLSERRAKATIEALKALNVDTTRLNAVGYGETRPIASNATSEGKAENRRVTAVVNK